MMLTNLSPANKCLFSEKTKPDLKTEDLMKGEPYPNSGFQWYYPGIPNKLIIMQSGLYNDSEFWKENKRKALYLLHNNIWTKEKEMMTREIFESLVASSNIPETPIEKIKELLSFLLKNTNFFGQNISFKKIPNEPKCFQIGFESKNEMFSLVDEAQNLGWLKIYSQDKNGANISLTINGHEIAEREKNSKDSKIAFVAMSFDSEMIKSYNEWIRPAISEAGFEPYIVLDQHPESDVTINDAILAGIKKAKFTIADFTHHKAGVYFEAGYALGRGQKVIYTCREDEIGTAHFDTRNYQHLVWTDGADLKKKLMDKIEVFIKV